MTTQVQAPRDLADQLHSLEEQLAPYLKNPKHDWPHELMAEIHATAGQITEIVAKDLRKAMQWPSATHSHPEGFYAGDKNINPTFTRPKTGWLKKQGYSLHKTTYTYGNRWDRVPMTAAFYIPDNLQAGDDVPIMWYFHGGGYVSNSQPYTIWSG
jgi:acetyl esterase/lipase